MTTIAKRPRRKPEYKRTVMRRFIIPDNITYLDVEKLKRDVYFYVDNAYEGTVKTVVRDGRKFSVTRVVAARVQGINGLIPANSQSIYINCNRNNYDRAAPSSLRMIAYVNNREIGKTIKELCVLEYEKELEEASYDNI